MKKIIDDENHQSIKRIFGVRDPYLEHEAANKRYVDAQIAAAVAAGGSGGILDGGTPSTDYSGGPNIDCGEVT